MTPAEHVPLAEVKNRLSEVVDRLEHEHGRVVITKHGRPAAVMLSLEDLESLEETLAILSYPELLAAIHETEVAAGRSTPMTKQEALAEIERRERAG
jgi:antitoxin YefM